MKITEHNAESNQVTERDMTAVEIADLQKSQQDFKQTLDSKETARTALLAKLGITAEESALLLG
jgi:hypothetical protein